ncbi:hypothetical protein BH10BDE1_BH10BDE1_07250 [soil metagenome]
MNPFSATVAVALLAVSSSAFATTTINNEIDEFYVGVRSQGMGGTYVNVVNDETAILTNPAGLGKLRDYTFTLVDPEFDGSFNDTDIVNISNFTDAVSMQGLLDKLNTAKGKNWHAKAQLFPSFVAPNFGIGLLSKFQYNASVDPTGTTYRFDYVNDWAIGLAYNFRADGGIVKFGVAGRLINRAEVHKDIPANSTGLELNAFKAEGMGLAADFGLVLTAPIAGLPALGISVRDAGNTSYNLREGMFNATANRPVDTEQSVDVALSAQPILGNRARGTFTIEYHGVTTPVKEDQEDFIKRTHAGFEVNFSDFAFLRVGANQGYWTGGIEFATERFQLQAASYGEEIGLPNAKKEDRRWVGKFAVRF